MNALKTLLMPFVLLIFMGLTACSESESVVESESQSSDISALEKLIDSDESLLSFEPNYNEEDLMSFAGTLLKEIYPVRVGQRMKLIDRNIDFEIMGDSAFAAITNTFEGVLLIAASFEEFNPDSGFQVDTLIQKPFTSIVTRNAVFVKVNNTLMPERNWKIAAISLPEGGTGSDNIDIIKLTVILPNGDLLIVNSPNDYFLSRVPGSFPPIPVINRGESVTVNIEIKSAYSDTDFVTLTYGASPGGPYNRAKRKFDLKSEEFDGQFYNRVYEQVFIVGQFPGYKHAIINAMPKQVIFDTETIVEKESWGVLYLVR